MIFHFLLIFTCFSITQQESYFSVSYQGYGIFTNSSPFTEPIYRPLLPVPQDPMIVNTQFFLFTRKNSNNSVTITWSTQTYYFIPNQKTTFIVHGWTNDRFEPWIGYMKNGLLAVENSNIIVVDWSGGAKQPYEIAVANTQIAGIDIANLINSYISKGLLSNNNIHIIGHSLGSHVAGFAGSRTYTKVSRITGLDPAGVGFDGMSPLVRLDPTDASFVDIIHTVNILLSLYILL